LPKHRGSDYEQQHNHEVSSFHGAMLHN
jgi:hypothetical protein